MHFSGRLVSKVVGTGILVLSIVPFFCFLLDSKRSSRKQRSDVPFKIYERRWLDAGTNKYDWLWSAKFSNYKHLTGWSYGSSKFQEVNINSVEDLKKACENFKKKTEENSAEVKSIRSKINYWCFSDVVE